MNWTTMVKVARFQLVDRMTYTTLPGVILAFDFILVLVNTDSATGHHAQVRTGALSAIYVFFLVVGALSIFRALPSALALGVGRRSYYAGTALLAVSLAVGYGLGLAVLAVVERATGGWGLRLHLFRVGYILSGPWYLTWLTSSVGLALLFVYGMWIGLVYRRWNLPGLTGLLAALAVALLAGGYATMRRVTV